MVGQHITTGPGKFAIACRILDGDPLAKFDAKEEELNSETKCQLLALFKHFDSTHFPTEGPPVPEEVHVLQHA